MDHTGGYYMAMAIMLAVLHRERTGEGQWVDLACTESALTLHGPALLDWTVNGRGTRADNGLPDGVNSNRSQSQTMAPHGIYSCLGDDEWIAIACRDDADWRGLAGLIKQPWSGDERWASLKARLAAQDELDAKLQEWTANQDKHVLAGRLEALPIPVSPVMKPAERIDADTTMAEFGLWPEVQHSAIGAQRVDGQPVQFSDTNWRSERGAPCLGEHTREVLADLLGLGDHEIDELYEAEVL